MSYAEALLYGAVQGLTEYLPISSSAHLILLPKFLNTNDPGLAFNVFLHIGTLGSTLFYFWRDWVSLLRNRRLAGLLVIATLPALLVGALVHDYAETLFRGNAVLIVTLSVGGVVLFLADHFFPQQRQVGQLGIKDAVWLGIAQCFALVPGVSRSGATITGGRILKMNRAEAARFSFLMSAPVTFAALVFEMRNWAGLFSGDQMEVAAIAGVSSFVFGIIAIGGLIQMLRRYGYLVFAIYRVALSGLIAWMFL